MQAENRLLSPLRLFLLCNLIYFLIEPLLGVQPFASPLERYRDRLPYSGAIRPLIDQAILASGLTARQFELLFDVTAAAHARALAILMVPMVALLVAALFPRSGRTGLHHVVFATHYVAALLLLMPLLALTLPPLVAGARALHLPVRFIAAYAELAHVPVILAFWLQPALRRAFGLSGGAALWRTLILAAAFLPLIQLDRLALFFTALWSI